MSKDGEDDDQSVTFQFQNFSNFLDGIGFGIEKLWYWKKYRIRYRKKFDIEKVSDSVSEIFGIEKVLNSL